MASPYDRIQNQIGETACETKVKYRDVFHLKNLYRYMHEWLINDSWDPGGRKTHSDPDWPENLYLTNQRSDGEEILIWWRMEKPGQSGYFKWVMDIDTHVLYLKNVETIINGQKVKANDGEVEIILRGRLVVDPDYAWRKHWFLKHMIDFYWRVINDDEMKQQRQELYQAVYRFHAALKQFMNLYTPEPDKRPFRAIGGLETR